MQVLIVGGGSAGWIAAATLQAHLNGTGPGPVRISLVEDPGTPRIGVGEATIPTVRDMLRRLGWDEAEFLRACDATFKHGIRFEGWSGDGTAYLHPFHRSKGPGWHLAAARWLASDRAVPFEDLVSHQGEMIRRNRAPRRADNADFGGAVPYAYHMDAEMFGDALADRCAAMGVARLSGRVTKVERADNGTVEGLRLEDGRHLQADLYVDCTGFRALLAGDGPGQAWVDQSHHLICDRAVTLRVPEDPASYTPPSVTRAVAMPAGWCWDIGLRQRRGRGYVYAARHADPETAEAALRAEIGAAADTLEARHIDFRVGRMARPWSGNVVAIGLAAGFLEPLESTGLYLAETAARFLAEMFPPAPALAADRTLQTAFNDRMVEVHDDIVHFILLHYAVAARRDTAFWRDAADPARHTERLAHLLRLWSMRPPSHADFPLRFPPFGLWSYEFVLFGSGWTPPGLPAARASLPGAAQARDDARRIADALPGHAELIAQLVAGTA